MTAAVSVKTMRITEYTLKANVKKNRTIALAADLHNRSAAYAVSALKKARPDLILVCGDVLHARIKGHSIYDEIKGSSQHLRGASNAMTFLEEARRIAPVFFSTGNHELYFDEKDRQTLRDLDIIFPDNDYRIREDLVIGGLSSPYHVLAGTGASHNSEESDQRWKMIFDNVNFAWLDRFEREKGYKILLCHHPEYYDHYIRPRQGIDLVLAGHTHGGQIRLFGKGLFAYGQGLFPKYSGGIYEEGRLIISRGLANTSKIPRIANPTELVVIKLEPR